MSSSASALRRARPKIGGVSTGGRVDVLAYARSCRTRRSCGSRRTFADVDHRNPVCWAAPLFVLDPDGCRSRAGATGARAMPLPSRPTWRSHRRRPQVAQGRAGDPRGSSRSEDASRIERCLCAGGEGRRPWLVRSGRATASPGAGVLRRGSSLDERLRVEEREHPGDIAWVHVRYRRELTDAGCLPEVDERPNDASGLGASKRPVRPFFANRPILPCTSMKRPGLWRASRDVSVGH